MVIEATAKKGSFSAMRYIADDKGHSTWIDSNAVFSTNPREMHADMKLTESLYQRSNFTNYRLNIVISPEAKIGKTLTPEEWRKLGKDCLTKAGIDHDNHPYVMFHHGSTKIPHLHIILSRINLDGKQGINADDIGRKFGKAADKVCKERGWQTARQAAENKKNQISSVVGQVLAEKPIDLQSFSGLLRERGLITQQNIREGRVTGLRIAMAAEYSTTPSVRQEKAGQGYKLSEIPVFGGSGKYSVNLLNEQFGHNFAAKEKAEREKAEREKAKQKPSQEKPATADKNADFLAALGKMAKKQEAAQEAARERAEREAEREEELRQRNNWGLSR